MEQIKLNLSKVGRVCIYVYGIGGRGQMVLVRMGETKLGRDW